LDFYVSPTKITIMKVQDESYLLSIRTKIKSLRPQAIQKTQF
jgi:hypothetical protein